MFDMLKKNRLRMTTGTAAAILLAAILIIAAYKLNTSVAQTKTNPISLNTAVSFPIDI